MSSLLSSKIQNQYSFKKTYNFKIKISKLISQINKFKRFNYLYLNKNQNVKSHYSKIANDINFDDLRNDFEKSGFVFIENFFDKNFIIDLKNNWPKRFFFRPKYLIEKSYDTGFKYLRHYQDHEIKYINHFEYLKQIYKFLISEKFGVNLSKLIKDKYNLSCYSITTSIAYQGSCLFPHVDDIAITNPSDLVSKSMINCIFFIHASPNNSNSGGTGIYKDNQFLEPLFVPSNLINTLLIYKTDRDLFHGFKEIPKDSFRYAITAQFNQEE